MNRSIVVQARDGDHAAFSEIAAASIGRLTAVARLVLRDEFRAQDVVQDALVDAWRDIRSLRDPDRLDGWLYRIVLRACYLEARRDRRRGQIEVELMPVHHPTASGPDARVETRDELERALHHLTADQRAVLVLTYYVDLPLADAAEVLAIPIGTMKSRLSRATQALRAALEADNRHLEHLLEPTS